MSTQRKTRQILRRITKNLTSNFFILFSFRLKAENYDDLKAKDGSANSRKNSEINGRKYSDLSSTRKLSEKNVLEAKVPLKKVNFLIYFFLFKFNLF
jgi:hypothetical protein